MPAKTKGDEWAGLSIEGIIDHELGRNHAIRDGASAYAKILHDYRTSHDELQLLVDIMDFAAWQHRQRHGTETTLLTFSDREHFFLFDLSQKRTIMAWSESKYAAPKSRDGRYHNAAPSAPQGHDKAHMIAHAQGGFEGGPNYFPQVRHVNQGRSDSGKLWRKIERHFEANARLKAFVRLHYDRGNHGENPDRVEYGIVPTSGLFRSVIFPNT